MSHMRTRIPGPPIFQCVTLKSWGWPGDKAIIILPWLTNKHQEKAIYGGSYRTRGRKVVAWRVC